MRPQPGPDPIPADREPPDGFALVWVPENVNEWRLVAAPRQKCRRPGCRRPAVAEMRRSNGWWRYCDWHLYGRRIEDGRLLGRKAVPV